MKERMGNEFVSSSFLLLFLVTLAHGVTSDGVNVLRLPSMDFVEQKEEAYNPAPGGHSSSHMGMGMGMGNTMNPGSKVFAVIKDFEVGKTRPYSFRHVEDPTSLEFLPKEKTQNFPLSSKALPELLRFFSITPSSPQALAMKDAITRCESEPVEGEMYHCPSSLESLADFAHNVFGSDNSEFRILRTSLVSKSTPLLQNYTVLESKEISTGKIIACHYLSYPYALYYCHVEMKSMNKVFVLSLIGENGERVNAPFLCHVNTAQWDPNSITFRVTGDAPGDSELCHLFPTHDMVVIPK